MTHSVLGGFNSQKSSTGRPALWGYASVGMSAGGGVLVDKFKGWESVDAGNPDRAIFR